MTRKWQGLSSLLGLAWILGTTRGHYHHGKDSDFYGEYYLDRYDQKVYTYCYEKGFLLRHHCRPPPTHYKYSTYQTEEHQTSYYATSHFLVSPSYSHQYHHYDGRGNINVGKGQYYLQGRDLVVECDFPSSSRHLSNVIWYRKSHGNHGYAKDHDYHRQNRYRYYVENWGENGSRLIIRDYRPVEDDGVYRCFATRYRPGRYIGGRDKDTIYMEIDVYPRKWAWD
ncbi:uncharacterized protein LOC131885577 [Tigriopus californicus]|uniref:uncharacterized protein LOC131885577 n=1 Tax=Tigriopus californicus TaxID=6832 RepID=UPI0027DA73D1|nr:uncharacterized protein LOC131885577 [Tigriopus californicus]